MRAHSLLIGRITRQVSAWGWRFRRQQMFSLSAGVAAAGETVARVDHMKGAPRMRADGRRGHQANMLILVIFKSIVKIEH